MLKRYIHTIILVCVATLHTSADVLHDNWDRYTKARTSGEQANALIAIGTYYYADYHFMEADSILGMAVDAAKMSGNDTILVRAYDAYLRNNHEKGESKHSAIAADYAKNLLYIADKSGNNDWLYLAHTKAAMVLLDKNSTDEDDTKEALENVNKAFYYAGLTNNDTFKVDCFLVWGECLEGTNKKLDAFRNYLNALYMAQKNQNKQQIYDCYGALSHFYLVIGNYKRASEYTIKQFALLSAGHKIQDSTKIMSLLSDLSIRYYYGKERTDAEKITNKLIDYAKRHHDMILYNTAIFNHRSFLSENGLYNELADFYTKQYPEELNRIREKDTIAYYRIMVYVCENRKQIDSALYYLEQAEKRILIEKNDNKIYVSNFMKRYGQFLLRIGNTQLAKAKMEASFKYAQEADYLPYLVETSAYLDSLNYKTGDLQNAYLFTKLNAKYTDEQQAVTRQDAMLLMEIDNEAKQRELLAKQEEEHTEHRHNVQYMGIVVSIISIFVILMMLGYFKVSKVIIKSLGFFSFIFFFEFIILLADHKIMEITHHEPWKMLAIKILIISMLLPFHHWIEHKVIHYLTEHKLVAPSRFSFKKWFGKKPAAAVIAEKVKAD